MNMKKFFCFFVLALAALAFTAFPTMAAEKPIKIGIIQGLSGPLEIYGKAEVTGFEMGLEYFHKRYQQDQWKARQIVH